MNSFADAASISTFLLTSRFCERVCLEVSEVESQHRYIFMPCSGAHSLLRLGGDWEWGDQCKGDHGVDQ